MRIIVVPEVIGAISFSEFEDKINEKEISSGIVFDMSANKEATSVFLAYLISLSNIYGKDKIVIMNMSQSMREVIEFYKLDEDIGGIIKIIS